MLIPRWAAPGHRPQPNATPEQVAEMYASQLRQLNDMGFYDEQENIRVLIEVGGNVNAAVDRLLSGGL